MDSEISLLFFHSILTFTNSYFLHQTLYKIARKEGIELAQPFNAVTTSWSQNDLNQALSAIKNGVPVQKAAAQYKIPTGKNL